MLLKQQGALPDSLQAVEAGKSTKQDKKGKSAPAVESHQQNEDEILRRVLE